MQTFVSTLESKPVTQVDPVVDRWVSRPSTSLPDALRRLDPRTDLRKGELRLDGDFRPAIDGRGRVSWKAPARLVGRGPSVVRAARVEVEIIAWADDLLEVTVRSNARHVLTWGERRERRYFALAHEAASRVASALSPETTASVAA